MAIFQIATNAPPKSEIIAEWIRTQPWRPTDDVPVELLGGFHLDDPEGEVGMQVFVVQAGDTLLQVPLTYREAALAEPPDAFIATMEHSVLGTRFLHDGLRDERFTMVLAGVTAAGYGQALGFAKHDDRWLSVPDELTVTTTGTLTGRRMVDQLAIQSSEDELVVLANGSIELTIYRQLIDRPMPPIALTTTVPGHPSPLVLASLREL